MWQKNTRKLAQLDNTWGRAPRGAAVDASSFILQCKAVVNARDFAIVVPVPEAVVPVPGPETESFRNWTIPCSRDENVEIRNVKDSSAAKTATAPPPGAPCHV